MIKTVVLPGDGIGPEVMNEAVKVIKHVCDKYKLEIDLIEADIGGAAIDRVGVPLPEETRELCHQAGAVLLGSIGGPRWEHLPTEKRPESGGLLALRKELKLYANLRPVIVFEPLRCISPLSNIRWTDGVDLLTVREISSGIYYGHPRQYSEEEAVDTMIYRRSEIERIARVGFESARKRRGRVASIDKANVLACSVLWRKVVNEVAQQFPEIELTHMYVDNAAMQLVLDPCRFDVILTENLFGDILSDESAALAGSVGMLPSASLGESVCLYEPAGGSAPDIAGRGIANPIAQILSAALMFDYSLGMPDISLDIHNAVEKALKLGYRPADIAGEWTPVSTSEMGDVVAACLMGESVPDRNHTRHPLHFVFSGFADPI